MNYIDIKCIESNVNQILNTIVLNWGSNPMFLLRRTDYSL